MAIFSYLYVFWTATWFILTMLIAFILLLLGRLLPELPGKRYSNFILKWWALIWSTISFMPMRAEGREKAKGVAPMVMVTNHGSFLDTPACYITIPVVFNTLAKKELLKLPIMGEIFKSSGIMVDRSSPESRKASLGRMKEALTKGVSIMIFPEGTQNRTSAPLQKFYDGAFRLAISAQVPLMPIVTLNSRWLMPQAKVGKMRPGKITQVYLDPIPTKGMTEADVTGLRERVEQLMEKVLRERDPKLTNA